MKITMMGTFPPIKGISEYCVQLASALGRLIRVDFVSFSHIYPERLYPGGTREEGAAPALPPSPGLSVRRPLAWFNPLSWAWAGLSARGSILHLNWWTWFLAPVELSMMAMARLQRRIVVMTVHNVLGHETHALDRWLTRIALSLAHHVIVHTEENRRQLVELFCVSERRVSVIPYGALTMYADERVSREDARAQLDVAADERVLLHFGYIREYKGLDVLLRALRKTLDAGMNARLVIAGTCWGDWTAYERLIGELGLAEQVTARIGYVPSAMIKVYFAAADLVMLPYRHFEAQSGPGNIALAFGRPMVVTRTGGLPQLVRDDDAIAQPGEVDSLTRAILKCAASDEKLAALAKDSAALAETFSWPEIAERTVQLYRTLTA